jgi:hypothetical protein
VAGELDAKHRVVGCGVGGGEPEGSDGRGHLERVADPDALLARQPASARVGADRLDLRRRDGQLVLLAGEDEAVVEDVVVDAEYPRVRGDLLARTL